MERNQKVNKILNKPIPVGQKSAAVSAITEAAFLMRVVITASNETRRSGIAGRKKENGSVCILKIKSDIRISVKLQKNEGQIYCAVDYRDSAC